MSKWCNAKFLHIFSDEETKSSIHQTNLQKQVAYWDVALVTTSPGIGYVKHELSYTEKRPNKDFNPED